MCLHMTSIYVIAGVDLCCVKILVIHEASLKLNWCRQTRAVKMLDFYFKQGFE